jgi:hypothetical protein
MACITKAKIKGMPRGHRLGGKGPWIEQIFHVVTQSSKITMNKLQFKKPPNGWLVLLDALFSLGQRPQFLSLKVFQSLTLSP